MYTSVLFHLDSYRQANSFRSLNLVNNLKSIYNMTVNYKKKIVHTNKCMMPSIVFKIK